MSHPPPPEGPSASTDAGEAVDATVSVVVAVSMRTGPLGTDVDPAATLAAVDAQVYEPADVVVVGGGEAGRAAAGTRRWVPDFGALLDGLERSVTHVWILHDDARPRPDALRNLVVEATRIDASVAGSKLLRADRPEVLESVGGATDVFEVPYLGLEDDEVDLQQYDVIRDVAFVSGASVLVRRDLLRGLGGPDPALPPVAAAVDLCQRARLAGGRVVIVPSSEVLHTGACSAAVSPWREQAGRIRSALKAYSAVTLAWVLPVMVVNQLVAAVFETAIGRRAAILDLLRAWGWNALHLRSTLVGRRQARRAAVTTDAELFRFQIGGSQELRAVGSHLYAALERRFEEDEPGAGDEDDGPALWQRPSLLAWAGGALLLLLAVRDVLFGGLPTTGYALPLRESAAATLAGYAGGWSFAGLGSALPQHPSVGAVAAVQWVLLSKAGLAATVLTMGAVAGAMVGMARLLGRLGADTTARSLGAVTYALGPAVLLAGGRGDWPTLLALGAVPWALLAATGRISGGWSARLGSIASTTLTTGLAAVFVPWALLLPTALLLFGWVAGIRRIDGRSVLRAAGGAVLAVPFLAPWIVGIAPDALWAEGPGWYWSPPVLVLAAAVLAVVAVVSDARWRLGALGAASTAGGLALVRTSGIGWGREPGAVGALLLAVGLGVLAAAAAQVPTRGGGIRGTVGRWVGLAAAFALAASALLVVADGAVGLGEDRFREPLAFTVARSDAHGPDRVLLVGAPGSLPGDARELEGAAYRVVSGPVPTYDEAFLAPMRPGDRALDDTLLSLLEGRTLRAGELLAGFGVRWVVLVDETVFSPVFEGQLDLRPLPIPPYTVFEFDGVTHRAYLEDGRPWRFDPPGYEGPAMPGGTAVLLENAHPRWGPDRRDVPEDLGPSWANAVAADAGRAVFSPIGAYRTQAQLAGLWAVLLLALAVSGRRRRSPVAGPTDDGPDPTTADAEPAAAAPDRHEDATVRATDDAPVGDLAAGPGGEPTAPQPPSEMTPETATDETADTGPDRGPSDDDTGSVT